MSDFRAIGGVSATLQLLLRDRMELPDGLPDILVVVGPPPLTPPDQPMLEDPRVTLFLYRVNENGALKNQEIPGQGTAGAYGYPPLALNLHYLVTASGNRLVRQGGNGGGAPLYDETLAHFLLGSAMRVLHDYPQVVDTLVTRRVPSGQPILHDSLRSAYEAVKLSLEPLSLEDVTKVWTALALRYRLCAGYAVTVVQIESRTPRRYARPVGMPLSDKNPPAYDAPPAPGPVVQVVTLQTPYISELRVRRAGETIDRSLPYARIADTLVVLGTQLAGAVVRVDLGALQLPVVPTDATRIELLIPDNAIPGVGPIPPDQLLKPGPLVVSVASQEPAVPGTMMRSNEAVLMLVPSIIAPVNYVPATRVLTVTGRRLWDAGLDGQTIVGRASVDKSGYSTASDTQLVMTLPTTLPARDLSPAISDPLGPNVAVIAPSEFAVTIRGQPLKVTPTWPAVVPRATLPALLAAAISDAAVQYAAGAGAAFQPFLASFTQLAVGLVGTRLVVLPGVLTDPITITASGGSGLAAALGYPGAGLAGAVNVALSGALAPFPSVLAAAMELTVQVGALAPVTVSLPRPLSLADLANKLQAAVNAANPAAAYTGFLVGVVGEQLALVPGAAGSVSCGPTPADAQSAIDLQLAGTFGVRARVRGAESFDDVTVSLP
jgi:hypothetical protein